MNAAAPPVIGEAISSRLGQLSAAVRGRGVRCGVGELLAAHRAMAVVDPLDSRDVREALRAVMCSSHADLSAFDEAFEEVFGATPLLLQRPTAASEQEAADGVSAGIAAARDSDAVEREMSLGQWSDLSALAEKDFALYSEDERAMARRVMRRLARREADRPSLRTRPSSSGGTRIDTRATIRAAFRNGGELPVPRWRRVLPKPRPLVLVCDVSASMRPYARMLLQYLQAAVLGGRRVEAFVFSTRLTHVTRELALEDPDRALARLGESLDDFASGTRIGASLAELNRSHGRRIGRGAVTVILSDGWDRGEPAQLGAEMARLRRCSHRLIWLNPLAADPRFEPLTRGMVAALPHTDHLMAGNSLASLEALAALIDSL